MITYQPDTLLDHTCPYHMAPLTSVSFSLHNPSFMFTFECGDYSTLYKRDISFYMNTKKTSVSTHRVLEGLKYNKKLIYDRIFSQFEEYLTPDIRIINHDYVVVTPLGVRTLQTVEEFIEWYRTIMLVVPNTYPKYNAKSSKILIDNLPIKNFIPSCVHEGLKL